MVEGEKLNVYLKILNKEFLINGFLICGGYKK